ncbi:MAG: PEP/pyruvate-binding domain-containing protein, partial [bacterium]
ENMNLHTDNLRDEQVKKQFVRTDSLLDHYAVCLNLINTAGIDARLLAWVFTYVRLSTIKELRIYMRHNYQTKDISHMQSELSLALARAYAGTFFSPGQEGSFSSSFRSLPEGNRALNRVLIRNIINFIPRGGGNGDELRLFILDTMRRHGIREGHRPGIDDPFIEQWHQKLHSNCTPEDITICEAYIAFQETNSIDLFYRTLWERGGISRDFLRTMARPLTHEPRHMPNLIPDLKHLLWILKQIHGGSHNFQYLLTVSRWQFDGELFSMLEDVKNNFGAWWLPGKIVDCRNRLKQYLRNSECPRDPLMIDVALDNIYKASIERMDLRTLSGDDLMALIQLTLQNVQLSYDHEKTTACIDLWERIKYARDAHAWSPEWGLQALAALNYIQLAVQSHTDELHASIQPKARVIGESCAVPESYITHFAEEVIRSQSTFSLSKLIDALFPMLLRTARIGCWKIISQGRGRATGVLSGADSLCSIQGTSSEKRRIMAVDKVDGIEEVPPWVSAILTMSDVDILSHISIRCRSSNILLSTCYDRELFEKIKIIHEGKRVTVSIENNMVHYREAAFEDAQITAPARNRAGGANSGENRSSRESGCGSRKSKGYGSGGYGSKSGNLNSLRGKVSDFVKVPSSAVIPYEVFEEAIRRDQESLILINELASELYSEPENYQFILPRVRRLIHDLPIPGDLVRCIQEEITRQKDIISHWSESLEEGLITHIKKVWGSVWNERAYLSHLSRKLKANRIRMRVLVQKVIPADYAFVIHTHNPVSNKKDEILAEIVVGLGETLAGNSPGSPLGVILTKGEHNHTLLSYPSKQIAYLASHQGDSCIVRSDSNDEDLSGSPGAGLYDSYFIHKPTPALVRYDQERLFWDKGFQRFMFDSIARIAEEVEDIMQCPQDIEAIYANGSFYVVQTRNQIVSSCSS